MESGARLVGYKFTQLDVKEFNPSSSSSSSPFTHRLQIAMDYLLVIQQAQAFDNRVAEPSDEAQTESLIVVLLN